MALKKNVTAFLSLLISFACFSQQQVLSVLITTKLDSVRTRTGAERHFGELYWQTTLSADAYIESLEGEGKSLMKKLEESFAIYFFRAVEANNNNTGVPKEWKNYFSGNYSSLQLKLMGANAHINGDIWQALTDNFTVGEIRHLKPFYKKYYRSIRNIYDGLFESGIRADKRLHDLHKITLGLDKMYGRMMLKKWRNRQLRLAILRSAKPERFKRVKEKIDRKRLRIDRMIICRLDGKE